MAVMLVTFQTASAFDLKGILNGGNSTDGRSTVGSIIGAVSSLVSSDDVSIKDMTGSWTYSAPAVTFKSDNFLQQAGGAAASSTIEGKLKPYYQRAGIDKLTLEVKADSTFVAKVGQLTVRGTLSQSDTKGALTFNIKALGKIPAGKINGFVSKGLTGERTLTFDATKLLALAKTITGATGNATLNSISSILDAYKGMNIGVKLRKK